MGMTKISEADFIRVFEAEGAEEVARRAGMAVRAVYLRRSRIEKNIGRPLVSPNSAGGRALNWTKYPKWLEFPVKNGNVLVCGDCHYWPGYVSTAHRAFVKFAKKLQPKVIILNGDVLDGASISRHPPMGWDNLPSLESEVTTCQERLHEIERAAPNAKKAWTLGNHDARFEMRLATVAPEFAKVHGTRLKDHFPYWHPTWAVRLNDDVVVKHRYKGGIHATHNNTVSAGKNIVTNHLHGLKSTPFTDYNGTRFGFDTGTLADIYGPQFEYLEDNPRNWGSGFGVLSFVDGRFLEPEICRVIEDGQVSFRGQVIDV